MRSPTRCGEPCPRLAAYDAGPAPDDRDPVALDVWATDRIARMEALVGSRTVALVPGTDWRPLHPLEGIPEGKGILVEVGPDAAEGLEHAARLSPAHQRHEGG